MSEAPERPIEPLFISYKIEPTSCVCGGNIAWLGQRPSGAWEMIGCVCHQTPLALVGRTLDVKDKESKPSMCA